MKECPSFHKDAPSQPFTLHLITNIKKTKQQQQKPYVIQFFSEYFHSNTSAAHLLLPHLREGLSF